MIEINEHIRTKGKGKKMIINNHTTTNIEDLEKMRQVAADIIAEIKTTDYATGRLTLKANRLLNEARIKTSSAGLRHFKCIVDRYYTVKAQEWLEENALPPEFDEWQIITAARFLVIKEAGITATPHYDRGWFSTDTFLG